MALLGEVEQPAGGADDDLDALGERVDLGLVGPAAVDGQHTHGAQGGRLVEVAGDLDRELTGGDDDEGLRLARLVELLEALLAGAGDVLEQRDAEAERLASAGLGLADDVVALHRHGEGHRLDGEGVGDARLGEGLHDLRLDAEVREGAVRGRRGVLADGRDLSLRIDQVAELVGLDVSADLVVCWGACVVGRVLLSCHDSLVLLQAGPSTGHLATGGPLRAWSVSRSCYRPGTPCEPHQSSRTNRVAAVRRR